MRHHREDFGESLCMMLAVVAAIPVVLTVLVALVAGCFTVIWHIGNWVGWW